MLITVISKFDLRKKNTRIIINCDNQLMTSLIDRQHSIRNGSKHLPFWTTFTVIAIKYGVHHVTFVIIYLQLYLLTSSKAVAPSIFDELKTVIYFANSVICEGYLLTVSHYPPVFSHPDYYYYYYKYYELGFFFPVSALNSRYHVRVTWLRSSADSLLSP